uniref:Odorant Binding Protein 19 n=1 Tax=Dendrolimus punctatus TaxID=238572 RepID=A0A2K8GKL5_9NEOP|nr:Odorant Binding Protein 19 [Dendrolimus punctatus]
MSENKTILLLLCLFVLVNYVRAADDRPEVTFKVDVYRNVYQAIYKCISETGVNPEVIQTVRAGNYEADAAFKKFMYCAYVKSGYATEDGDIKIDDIAKEFPPEYNIITYLKKCVSSDSDPVDKIYNYFKCYQDTAPVRLGF